MGDAPWQGDACSLVEAFRAGERSPAEELAAVYAAIDASPLNAFSHLDREHATLAADVADVSKPFGGVPIGVKELDAGRRLAVQPRLGAVQGRHRHGDVDAGRTACASSAGSCSPAQTTASEFGGVNVTRTVLHGTTHNPWQLGRTPGGSSGGSAAAVAGGIADAGDGRRRRRVDPHPGRVLRPRRAEGARSAAIPLSPQAHYGNLTVVVGCLARSVRDVARWFDVVNGHDPRDPLSLPRVSGWEDGLGTLTESLRGLRVAIVADWGGAVVSPAMWDVLLAAADDLIADAGFVRVDGLDTGLPRMGAGLGGQRVGRHGGRCSATSGRRAPTT